MKLGEFGGNWGSLRKFEELDTTTENTDFGTPPSTPKNSSYTKPGLVIAIEAGSVTFSTHTSTLLSFGDDLRLRNCLANQNSQYCREMKEQKRANSRKRKVQQVAETHGIIQALAGPGATPLTKKAPPNPEERS